MGRGQRFPIQKESGDFQGMARGVGACGRDVAGAWQYLPHNRRVAVIEKYG